MPAPPPGGSRPGPRSSALNPCARPRPGRRLNFRVNDLGAIVTRLHDQGLDVDGPEAYPNGQFTWVHDPDGNQVEPW